jgi:hypothetical protein
MPKNITTGGQDDFYSKLCNSSLECINGFKQAKANEEQHHAHDKAGYDLDMYIKFRIILTWVSLFIILIGLVGNFISFLILINKKMRISTNVFLASLCVSAFIALIGLMINSVLYEILAYYIFEEALQKLYFFYPYFYPIITTFQMASILLTVCVSVNQFVCIYFSKANRSKKDNHDDCKSALVIVLIMYVISIIYCVPYWLKFKYSKENGGLIVTELGQNPNFNRVVHFWMYLPAVYVIPFSILIITNAYLLSTIMIARRRRKRLGMGKSAPPRTTESKQNNEKSKRSETKIEMETLIDKMSPPTITNVSISKVKTGIAKNKTGGMKHGVTIMLLAVVFFFFICQFPNLILHIITSMICSSENSNCSRNGFYQYSLAISKLLLICNLSFNFVIYCLFSEKFREVLFENFSCFNLKKNKQPVLPNLR